MPDQQSPDAGSTKAAASLFDPFKSIVKKEYSYLSFTNRIFITSDMAVSVQSYLGESDASGNTARFSGTKSEAEGTDDGVILRRGGTNTPNKILEHGTGKHYLILEGNATRVEFPVDIPYVSSLGVVSASESTQVVEPVLARDRLVPNQIDCYTADGKPVYVAAWQRVYILPSLGNREIKIENIDIRFRTSGKDLDQLNVDSQQTSQNKVPN